jgi:hypothetical protein
MTTGNQAGPSGPSALDPGSIEFPRIQEDFSQLN